MYNFLNPKLKATVECNAICEDDYPAENLIEGNERGFMAYSVLKPPVELTFNFICPIEVKYIKIWPQIGSLKSTNFDVYGKSETSKDFVKLSQGVIHNEIGIVFLDMSVTTNHINFKNVFFNPRTKYIMGKMKQIKLCITQTHQRCAVVLKKVEIWGNPSSSCLPEVNTKIDMLWNRFDCRPNFKQEFSKPDIQKMPKVMEDVVAPEEFYDIITHEVMTFPMILPSGKIVDISTIDKHSKNEEIWGRAPSDPFTGISYSSNNKPVPDLVLKTQIETFMLKHSNHLEYKNVPRTLSTTREKRLAARESYAMHPYRKIEKIASETTVSSGRLTSLELAAHAALSKIGTKYTEKPKPVENCIYCFNCKNVDNIYKITLCAHFICWNCLTKHTSLTKCNCGCTFTKVDIIKFHKYNK